MLFYFDILFNKIRLNQKLKFLFNCFPFYKFTISYTDTSQHFHLKPLDPESFISKAKFAFEKVFGEIVKTPVEEKDINKYLTELYTNIAVNLRTDEEIPQVATVYLRDSEILN